MKVRKKLVVVEAIQFTGNNLKECYEFMNEQPFSVTQDMIDKEYLLINTLEGLMKASKGDYIIKGVYGECYPCKPDIFKETYEIVEG